MDEVAEIDRTTAAKAKPARQETVALVLGGGAPTLTMMAGALAAFDEAGIEFDVISTSGAGMLVGLLYAAPAGGDRRAALHATVEMGVHDAIYRLFPVNYKVFHKPGALAEQWFKTVLSPFARSWAPRCDEERFLKDLTHLGWRPARPPASIPAAWACANRHRGSRTWSILTP